MVLSVLAALAIQTPGDVADRVLKRGLTDLGAYRYLSELTEKIGGRLSGSPEAAKAVAWGQSVMRELGFQNVRLVPCMVPHWVRGKKQDARLNGSTRLSICALGGSVATPPGGIEAEVVEVHSLKEAKALGERGRGRIVFFNRPFDPTLTETFAAYGGANDQRVLGASAAAKSGAVGVLVRSMTLAQDDAPHTGAMSYTDGIAKIPAAALGIRSAEKLSQELARNPRAKVRFELDCKTLPDEPSANVVGEIVGAEFPSEVIVMGGHLDSWETGKGAHDDGAGVTQSLEALRLIKASGLRPRRTIRVVLFMNEENGGRGAQAYAEMARSSTEKHIAAIESDAGGFMPRSFSASADRIERVKPWLALLNRFGIERFTPGGGGSDIGPLKDVGAVLFGLSPDNQRYFDYHHARTDTLDKVNPRELEFGAIAMSVLAWLISEEGL